MKKFKREVAEKLIDDNTTLEERKFICEQEFMYFCLYYFTDFFTHKPPDFHFEAYQDLKFDRYKFLIWEWFREGAKTTIVKMFIIWCICYAKKHYIIFICYEKDTAKSRLYDIAFWLQSNKRLIADFGQLFYEDPGADKFSKKKAVSEFITTNKIKVEASSTQEPLRGRVYDQYRPDLLVFDDFENEKTKRSHPITQGIINNMDEAMSGISTDGNIIYLCNYISDLGSVEMLHQAAARDPLFKLHRVDVVMDIKNPEDIMSGKIAWPQKYVFTDSEANAKNALQPDGTKKVVSLESKRRTLNAKGRPVFEQEMLNQPIVKGDKVFDPAIIRKLIAADARDPVSVVGDWEFWEREYKPHHRYAIGADVAEGVGGDSCAAVLMDFSTHPRGSVVATYQNNRISPDLFAYELANVGKKFGECLIAPENNNQGFATITRLKDIYGNIYMKEEKGDVVHVGKAPTQYGWQTNNATKGDIVYQLKTDVHDGLIEIPDEKLLLEMLSYNNEELREIHAREGMTKHFDKLQALCIAWRMRHVATARYVSGNVMQESFDPHEVI